MKRCTECGGTELRQVLEPAELRIGPRVFVGELEVMRCDACGETFTSGQAGEAFELAAARWLAEHGFTTGEEIRFMRKAAGLRAADLAELLDVSPEAVSHWETGKHQAGHGTLATIAALVLDALEGSTATRDRLRALREPIGLAKVRLDVSGGGRAATG